MFSCALIGPDGSGKTSVCRSLERELPLPVKYVYMGVSPDSSNHMLPTTRLIRWLKRVAGGRPDTHGPRDHAEIRRPSGSLPKRLARSARAGLALFNRIGEEWFRQLLAWYYEGRLGRPLPDDIDEAAGELGFDGREEFYRALLREWLYCRGKSGEA